MNYVEKLKQKPQTVKVLHEARDKLGISFKFEMKNDDHGLKQVLTSNLLENK